MIVPGYPTLRPTQEAFWKKFWDLYVTERENEPLAPLVPQLT